MAEQGGDRIYQIIRSCLKTVFFPQELGYLSELMGRGERSDMGDMIQAAEYREKARSDIKIGAEISIAYLVMNVMAATIASYGLFVNSPAVIIGAMLIAMLLGPITGISLALIESDTSLLLRGMLTLFAGAAAVFATAYIIGCIHSDVPLTREILGRTTPNLADLGRQIQQSE